MANEDERYFYHDPVMGGLVSGVSGFARKRMFDSLMAHVQPTANTSVLDVGVTADPREDSNFFEKLYPFPEGITAVGVEDGSFLEERYPGLKFLRTDGDSLPFEDKSFDLAVSFAVVEHVGSREKQKRFIREVCRVGRRCCITTPNRWFPVEFHTMLPLVHWLPPDKFRSIVKAVGKDFLAREENLNLLCERDLLEMLPPGVKVTKRHFRLFGMISNLVFYIE